MEHKLQAIKHPLVLLVVLLLVASITLLFWYAKMQEKQGLASLTPMSGDNVLQEEVPPAHLLPAVPSLDELPQTPPGDEINR